MIEAVTKFAVEKVLVIDDNEIDRVVARWNIEKSFFASEIVLRESARKGLAYLIETAHEELPQVIFLDIKMPEIDGFGFLEEFEKLPETIKSRCNIKMLSSSIDPIDKERAKTNKYVTEFISKPIDRAKLQEIILRINGAA